MKWSPSSILATLAKALVTTLLFAVLLYFIPGRSGSVWAMALGFAVGTLLVDLIHQALGGRRKAAARRRSLRLWAFGFGILGSALFTTFGLLAGAGWSASQFTMAAVFGVVVGSSVGAALAGGWNAAYVGRSRSA